MKANELPPEKKPRKKREQNRFKKPIDLANVGKNNFVNLSLQIPYVRHPNNFKIVKESEDKVKILERAYRDGEYINYVKVFLTNELREDIFELPERARSLYLWIIYNLNPGKDIIEIDRKHYMETCKIKAENTYLNAVRDLIKSNFIARTEERKDLFWINPFAIFRGNRLEKYPDNVVKAYDYTERKTIVEGSILHDINQPDIV